MLNCLVIINKKTNKIKQEFHIDNNSDNNKYFVEKLLSNIENIKYKSSERVQFKIKNHGNWYTEKGYKQIIFCVYTEKDYKPRIAFEFIKSSITLYIQKDIEKITELLKQYHKIENVDVLVKLKKKLNEGISEATNTLNNTLIYDNEINDFKIITDDLKDETDIMRGLTSEIKVTMIEKNNSLTKLIMKVLLVILVFIILLIIILKII